MVDEFHFLRPYFLSAFVLLILLAWLAYKKNSQSNSWLKICDPTLASHLLVGVESRASLMPIILLLVAGSILILSLAGPAWQKLPQAVFKNEQARVYVLDLSRSMDATDVAPSRLTRAKLKLIDFLKSQKEGQVGLIAFAGLSHVVSPLTDDANTIIAMVPSLSTDIMPTQGSRPDLAILQAAQLLKQSANPRGDIVLITDGVNTDTLTSAQQVANEGYQLNVVGVGTVDGSPIPITEGGFLNDKNGAIVIPKLDINQLKELALAGSGQYTPLTVNDSDIKVLKKSSLDEYIDKKSDDFRELDIWRDEGHWLLLLAMPFVALGFRRGWLGMVVIATTIMPVDETMAAGWADLWQRKDQQAQEALQQGNPSAAAELFENNEWKGTAFYRDGQYDKAAEAFSSAESANAKYNLANSLARQGKLQEAIDIYDQVIEKQPDNDDAKFNRELIKKAMQQQDQQDSDQNQKDKTKDQSDQKNQDQQSQNQDQQNSDEQDQSQSESENQRNQQQGQKQDENKTEKDAQQNEQQSAEQKDKAEQDKQEQAKREEELKKQQESEKGDEAEQMQKQQEAEEQSSEQREIKQATQQWLRRIPDDPGGLMREKLYRQSQRERQRSNVENPW